MSGGQQGSRRITRSCKADMQNTDGNDDIGKEQSSVASTTTVMEGLQELVRTELANLAKSLNERLDTLEKGQENMRRDFSKFGEDLKKEIREEFAGYRKEIDRELEQQGEEVTRQKTALAETRARVSEIEDWRAGASEALMVMVDHVELLQEQYLDAQTRSRRNNIRVFNCPEDSELGKTVIEYVDQLLHTHLDLPDGTQLQIQRAHRALSKKPTHPLAVPRSIVVNFLSFETKQMVLAKAWEATIQVGDKRLGFDHDYPHEIVQRRKAYIPYKKILKAKGVRVKTPFTKMRIEWPDGEKTYNWAEEVAADMRKRGYSLEDMDGRRGAAATEETVERGVMETEAKKERPSTRASLQVAKTNLQEVSEWTKVARKKGASLKAKNRLQMFKN